MGLGMSPPSWLSGKASTPKAARLGNDGRGHSACHFPVVGGRMQHTLALRESQITTSKLIQVMWIRNLTELHNVCCHSNLAAEMVCKCHCNHIQSHTECRGRSSCRAHFSRFLDLGGLVRWLWVCEYVLGWGDLSFLLDPFHSLQSTHIHILIMYILLVYQLYIYFAFAPEYNTSCNIYN